MGFFIPFCALSEAKGMVIKMDKCKITVLRRTHTEGIFQEYSADKDEKCPLFKEGQEFIADDPSKMPEGFCAYAYTDISRDMVALMCGADYPWIKQENTAIVCCTDGLKPVIFKLERA